MARQINQEFVDGLGQEVVYPFFAVDLNFQSGPVHFWTGYGDLFINGTTYLGAGTLVNISAVEETTEVEAKGAVVTMTGIPSSFLSLALAEPYQGRECTIYFGIWLNNREITSQSGSIITTEDLLSLTTETDTRYLTEIFSGELDQMNISEEGNTSTIAVTAENVLIKLERPVVRRFTNEDQKSRFPSDRGLEFVADLQDKEVFWGRKAS